VADAFRYTIIGSSATPEEKALLISLWDSGSLGTLSPGQDPATVVTQLVTTLRSTRASYGDLTKAHGKIRITA
jgi:hypothetical protein